MKPAVKPAKPLVLVCGDDDFNVRQRAKRIYDDWCAELGGMDHEIIDATVSNAGDALKALSKLREALQTLPFFGTGKAVWLRDCNFLAEDRTSAAQDLTETLGEISQELKTFSWDKVRLLVSAGNVDKRRTFYKTIEKVGAVEHFAGWSLDKEGGMDQAMMFARGEIAKHGKDITEAALTELVARAGANSRTLVNEIEKLSIYVGARTEVSLDDVKAICTRNKTAKAFALADALGNRNLPSLLRRLDEELWEIRLKVDKNKSEIGLLYGMISKVRAMLLLKEMIREGWIKSDAAYGQFKAQLDRVPKGKLPEDKKFNPLAMHPFVLFNALQQVKNYSQAELVAAMELLLKCNRELIFSNLDESLVLQQALIKIVGSPAAAR